MHRRNGALCLRLSVAVSAPLSRSLDLRRQHDTRGNRTNLERPTQSEMGILLFQGRSTTHSSPEVGRVDSEFRPRECNPNSATAACRSGCPSMDHRLQGSRNHRHDCRVCRQFRSCMPGVQVPGLAHPMRAGKFTAKYAKFGEKGFLGFALKAPRRGPGRACRRGAWFGAGHRSDHGPSRRNGACGIPGVRLTARLRLTPSGRG